MRHVLDTLDGSWSCENTPSILAKSIFYYIQSSGHFICGRRYMTDRSDYQSILLAYTRHGEGVLKYRNQLYSVKKGQLFIIDCFEHQYYGTGKPGFWEFDWIHFTGSESKNYVKMILENNGPVFVIDENSTIPDNMEKIQRMVKEKDKRVDIIASKLIVEILTELLLKSLRMDDMQATLVPPLIRKATRIIERNYNKPISLDTLSEELCISKFHFSRLFKKHTGYSPYEYLIKQRLNQAKSLLKSTDYPIAEISQKVGFESTSHFIKVFKQHEKTTPLKFRGFWR